MYIKNKYEIFTNPYTHFQNMFNKKIIITLTIIKVNRMVLTSYLLSYNIRFIILFLLISLNVTKHFF